MVVFMCSTGRSLLRLLTTVVSASKVISGRMYHPFTACARQGHSRVRRRRFFPTCAALLSRLVGRVLCWLYQQQSTCWLPTDELLQAHVAPQRSTRSWSSWVWSGRGAASAAAIEGKALRAVRVDTTGQQQRQLL
eukprot:TRINITY_DN8504_c0_g1_i1.p4 TRINITY_DN8504_c0_g1~~TRINITY_DN8504_c0_g1_i1.p4  ORF type:complete len:135 (-),score=7.85 TRINITY_DN8504_c0_g1_i1:984-1388(-)